MICALNERFSTAKPTEFHKLQNLLAEEGRLCRQYAQNIDCIDFSPEVPYLSAKTVALHGRSDTVVCTKRNCHVDRFMPGMFQTAEFPLCEQCRSRETDRARANLRPRSEGWLRPKIQLYGEDSPDASQIETAFENDIKEAPNAVIIAGTRLKATGARNIAKEFCKAAKGENKESIVVWVSLERPPLDFSSLIDYVFCWDCDDFASWLLAEGV